MRKQAPIRVALHLTSRGTWNLEGGGMLLGLASSNLEDSHLLLQQTNSIFKLDVLLHKLAVYVRL